jgi:hypothetical protein
VPAAGGCGRAQWTIPQRGAAKIGGKNRQAPPDLVIRFNSRGAKGMIAKPLPGRCGWFTGEHKAASHLHWGGTSRASNLRRGALASR